MISDREYTRRMLQTVLTVTATILILAALYVAREALMLIYISTLVAMGFSPLVRVLARPGTPGRPWHVSRGLAILVIYLVIVGAAILVGLLVIPPLAQQAGDLWNLLPEKFNDLQSFFISHKLLTRKVTLQEAVQNAPAGSGGNAVATVFSAISGVIGGAFGLVTILVLSFYLLVEAESLFSYFTRLLPVENRARFKTAAREIVNKVSRWLRAQFILAAVMGTIAAVGLGLLRVPYFYVVALIAAVGETIPIVGPIVGGVAAVAVAAGVSTRLALTVGVFFVVLHELESNVLVPKIMQRRVGVSPVAVIVAFLIGASIWGLVGAVLAIPTAAILAVIVDELAGGRAAA